MDEEWSSDAIEALQLRLVRAKADVAVLEQGETDLVDDFHPTFVYPIFGQEETIFGYRNLEIQLHFSSGALKQYLHVDYSSKFPSTTTVSADDPEKTLYEFIPPTYSKDEATFHSIVEADSTEFKPLGNKIGAFREKSEEEMEETTGSGKGKGKAKRSGIEVPPRPWKLVEPGDEEEDEEVLYEAYQTNWDTPGFKEYHRRMQIFVLLYIEGAQYIDEEDPRWQFVTLFERRKRRDGSFGYHFVGFVSFYSFFCWPDTKRLRLAQFVMLPPYQGQGHGSALYTLCYNNVLSRPEIIEDPSEIFEDMRDKCDLHTLITSHELDDLSAPLNKPALEVIRKKYKIADRQFYRLIEMLLLLNLDESNAVQVKAFRLTVKRRLFTFNRETLTQLEEQEKKDKLHETYTGVKADYRRITAKFTSAA
ncbi:BZ3500_MvSof-1268-A1-R1_Chr4-3g07342 [Microbotryum saponariae]|uniref:Histone acetyltransferase type B catalytic subunit n=1 Tax=Microbotryum saponariae TaxID=289078 RepID=A0A2X0KWX4_9BASI|nr:BZ3500_MvSof-1268-A1-R1_Chr4-3g07342 [Microbotryum saponariae]SDA07005.1 BZ3501_MvSof-1269-A2-R1_Chr4-2g07051 [Microbotryum saponariae]